MSRFANIIAAKPEYFTPADFQYTTAITKKYLIKMRNTILAQVASIQNAPSFDPATEAVMVVLDFASLNLGGSLEKPQEPGIGATAIAANFRKFNERERKVGFLQVVLPDGSGVEEGVGIYMRTAPFDLERFKEGEMPPFRTTVGPNCSVKNAAGVNILNTLFSQWRLFGGRARYKFCNAN